MRSPSVFVRPLRHEEAVHFVDRPRAIRQFLARTAATVVSSFVIVTMRRVVERDRRLSWER